jgi:hypothetical protein
MVSGKSKVQNAKRESKSNFGLHLFCLIILSQLLISPNALAKKPKVYSPVQEYKYQQKILKKEAKDQYKKSLLPQSGLMTREEYEALSKDIPNADKVVKEYKPVKPSDMKYVPQPKYELKPYNNPPGSPELHLVRKFKFDRQQICTGITSPNKDILVYPTIYYYAGSESTACDLFTVNLEKNLSPLERVMRANVVKRNPNPIMSTEKDTRVRSTFRSLTPIDFSPDGSKLIVKEKIGNFDDGIWQTNLWIYDFQTQQTKNLSEVRDAIKFFWYNSQNINLNEKRWDITPLGFSAENPDRIIVSAYGYTGKAPSFLGNWSIDTDGKRTELVSLFDAGANIKISGLKAVQVGIVNPATVYNNEKLEKKLVKKHKKEVKKATRKLKREKKAAYHKNLSEIRKQGREGLKQIRNSKGQTGLD